MNAKLSREKRTRVDVACLLDESFGAIAMANDASYLEHPNRKSLCTGVTYDRTSIQRWLDSGNNTCPATMQVLNSKEFVPNRTLQRLIKIWADSVQTKNDSRVDSPSSSVVTWEDVEVLVKEMRAQKDKIELLSKFICFAKESEENCDFLAKFDGFVEMLVEFLVGDKTLIFSNELLKFLL
ncbi:U-box domain-containing family protein [Salix suchowensis]|nr:U-box domain-containing family protein [Salix suchowensis]